MLPYTVITKKKVWDKVHGVYTSDDAEMEMIYEEQQEKLKELGFKYHDWSHDYKVHFFNSVFFDEETTYMMLYDAIAALASKEGIDLVQFENGNYGFVAYYNENENGFEILEVK